jgi:hypothetical protein
MSSVWDPVPGLSPVDALLCNLLAETEGTPDSAGTQSPDPAAAKPDAARAARDARERDILLYALGARSLR